MTQVAIKDNARLSLRIRPKDKALLLRAVALQQTDLTGFVLGTALEKAQEVIDKADRLLVSERDMKTILDLVENPPPPNAKMLAAFRSLPPFK